MPQFGRIKHICVPEYDVLFFVNVFSSMEYSVHLATYIAEFTASDSFICITPKELSSHLILNFSDDHDYISKINF